MTDARSSTSIMTYHVKSVVPGGPTMKRSSSSVAASGNRVGFVDLAAQLASDGYGCDYHPSEITARKMADVTAAKIREVTGWR